MDNLHKNFICRLHQLVIAFALGNFLQGAKQIFSHSKIAFTAGSLVHRKHILI